MKTLEVQMQNVKNEMPTKTLRNIGIIGLFLDYHNIKSKDNNVSFSAVVEYVTHNIYEETVVISYLNGYDSHIIKIKNKGDINESVHGDFDPRYQDFDIDITTNSLMITGQSPKMGRYKVKITPL